MHHPCTDPLLTAAFFPRAETWREASLEQQDNVYLFDLPKSPVFV